MDWQNGTKGNQEDKWTDAIREHHWDINADFVNLAITLTYKKRRWLLPRVRELEFAR